MSSLVEKEIYTIEKKTEGGFSKNTSEEKTLYLTNNTKNRNKDKQLNDDRL